MHNYKVLSPPLQGTPPGDRLWAPQDKFQVLSCFWQAILLLLLQFRGCTKNAYPMYGNSLYNKHSRLARRAFISLPQLLLHQSHLGFALPLSHSKSG